MDNWLTYLLVGTGAFFLGRRIGRRDAAHEQGGPTPGIPYPTPMPGPPDGSTGVPPLPPVTEGPGPGYADAWRKTNFEVRIYPKGADRVYFPPPSHSGAVTVSDGCETIAIGEDAWSQLEGWAATSEGDPGAVVDQVVANFAGGCAWSPSAAAKALRRDIRDLVMAARGIKKAKVIPVPLPPQSMPAPQHPQSAPSYKKAQLHQATKSAQVIAVPKRSRRWVKR